MSHSFPPSEEKKEIPLPVSGFTFGPGIADAATSLPIFIFSSSFGEPSIAPNQPTSHLLTEVPPAEVQRVNFRAGNSTDSLAIKFSNSNGESSMNRTATRTSMIPFSTPTVYQTATSDAVNVMDKPSFTFSVPSSVPNLNISANTPFNVSCEGPLTYQLSPSAAPVSDLVTPNILWPNSAGSPFNLFSNLPSSQTTPKISGTTAFGTSAKGTPLKFSAILGADTMMDRSYRSAVIDTCHQCITVMKEYERKSLEELRLEDYLAGTKGPIPNTLASNWSETYQDMPSLGYSFTSSIHNFSLPNQLGSSSNLFPNLSTGPTAQIITRAENVESRPLFGISFGSSISNYFAIPPCSHLLNLQSSINQLSKPSLTQIAQVKHLNFLVGIFTDSSEMNSSRFFYEPVVLLDSKITVYQTRGLLKQDFLRLTIHMWNLEIRSKVLERLKSLPNLANLNIQEDDVCVMPFEEVKLLYDPPKSLLNSFKLTDRPVSYLRSQESIDFYLICDSFSAAEALADEFRLNPEFTLSNLQLELECKGLCFGAASTNLFTPEINRPTFKFKVEISPLQVTPKDVLHSSIHQMRALHTKENPDATFLPSTIPIFSVLWVSDPLKNRSLAFTSFDIQIKKEFGGFDLKTGLFTVGISGIYQFNLNTNVKATGISADQSSHQIELRVDGKPKVTSHCIMSRPYCDSDVVDCQPVRISALLSLKVGEKVGIYAAAGSIVERPPYCVTRFSAFFFVPT